MKTKTLIITVVLAAAILAPLALAGPEDHPRPRGEFRERFPQGPRGEFDRPGMGPGMGEGNFAQMLLGRMGEELNLTDEQKEAIKKIAEDSKAGVKENRDAVHEALKNLNEAAEKGTEAEIIAAGKAAGDALTQQALNRAEVAKKIKAVLTEEQLIQFEEMKAKMKERMEQHREQMREGEGPHRGEGRPGGRGPRPEPPLD